MRIITSFLLLTAACQHAPVDPTRASLELDSDAGCAADSCGALPLGSNPGDACGPAGEGQIAYAECDPNRGLHCTAAPSGQLDAPPTCECLPGQSFSPQTRACSGARTGERPGTACAADSGMLCNPRRGLICASAQCECAANSHWSEARAQCLAATNCP